MTPPVRWRKTTGNRKANDSKQKIGKANGNHELIPIWLRTSQRCGKADNETSHGGENPHDHDVASNRPDTNWLLSRRRRDNGWRRYWVHADRTKAQE